MLLSLQGRLRQKGGLVGKDASEIDVEDDEVAEVSGVPVLPEIKPKRGGTIPDPNSTQLGEVPRKVNFAEPESKVTDSALLSGEGK